jgi:hypothetical protein
LLCPAYGVGEDFYTAGSSERVLLEVQMLILGGDPSIADECHSSHCLKTHKNMQYRDIDL